MIEERVRERVEQLRRARDEISRCMVGQDRHVDDLFACLLAGGHALLEGVPGLGKTSLVKSFADTMALSVRRVQFTPDLMPADIIGTDTLVQGEDGAQEIRFMSGPIFTQVLLADEINRATPKTQSALLEAMQENAVTVGGVTRPLQAPFIVLATQNPIELEGTYPLPEAQLDRFILKITLDYPTSDELMQILARTTISYEPKAKSVLTAEEITDTRGLVREVVAAESIHRYAVALVEATHPERPGCPEAIVPFIRYGSSPRGAQALILAGKVFALLDGRLHVAPEDLRRAAPAALRHRIVLTYRAEAEGMRTDGVIETILAEVRTP